MQAHFVSKEVRTSHTDMYESLIAFCAGKHFPSLPPEQEQAHLQALCIRSRSMHFFLAQYMTYAGTTPSTRWRSTTPSSNSTQSTAVGRQDSLPRLMSDGTPTLLNEVSAQNILELFPNHFKCVPECAQYLDSRYVYASQSLHKTQ